MTLSALRTRLQFRLASLHVRAHQDGHREFNLFPRPAQLNVLADELASRSTRGPPSSGPGTPQAAKKGHSRTNSLSTKSERTSKNATVGPHTS
jgi:hypothetical protein